MQIHKSLRLVFLLFILAFWAAPGLSTVFYSKEEAMKLAFGEDATVEMQSLFPTAEQLTEIERLAKVKLESKLFSFYVGKKQDAIIGYAAIESHNVRTKPETLLVVLDPNGNLRQVVTLAFHEPPEYQPPERWFNQLLNRKLDDLSFGKDIQGVSGATLSTRAALNSARKVLAVFQVMLKQPEN
ncbi:FMN-binding protein [Methylomonas methanica]|uniref:FMN-binding domain protein n=1 Tax=Methylomonas methanica (strain DSM 25384 / MC09) TaxID=857087 RepID=G0A394_METMM|nr:FMN-binding protein [Methylomonas methanica]AEF99026.1 FMN-binding domain protein [Methylomonas methanica MC09]